MLPPPTLLVLAAGMGSRYGGLKQLDPVGPSGETVLDYGVYDAARAGFGRVVFIIRRDFDAQFREQVGAKYAGHLAVDYAYQSIDALPSGYCVPEGREKPWGTGHAVWCAREQLDGPFAVINADDFYGADSFAQLAQFLKVTRKASDDDGSTATSARALVAKAALRPSSARAAMVGFRLKNTLSENGAVSRGICRVDAATAQLQSIEEHTGILSTEVGSPPDARYSGDEITSMNCWGFGAPTSSFLDGLDTELRRFLDAHGHELKSECYLPAAVSALIARSEATVQLLPTTSQWFGVTYREDRAQVVARLAALVAAGEYPKKLFQTPTRAPSRPNTMSTTPPPQNLADVLSLFEIEGRFVNATAYGSGHINDTFLVHCKTSTGQPRRYIAQRINDRIFQNIPALMDNVKRVTEHLARKAAPPERARQLTLVPTRNGASYARDESNAWWRVYDFIEGAHTVDRVTTLGQAREAARAFGDFQAKLSDLPGPRLHETILSFHHTRSRFDGFCVALACDTLGRASSAQPEISYALSLEDDCDRLLSLLSRGEVSERITHNDTKINNVMLDDATGRAVAVIDFDTLMPGLPLYDFGDMVRTATSTTLEDDPEPTNMRFEVPLFEALVEGYLGSAVGPVLNATERSLLGFAGKLMTYETALRFLTDYLEGDVYFKTQYPEHNLVRARTQLALVRSIAAQTDSINSILEKHLC